MKKFAFTDKQGNQLVAGESASGVFISKRNPSDNSCEIIILSVDQVKILQNILTEILEGNEK